MPTIKLFLASSAELKADREQFEIFINRRNQLWQDRGVFFELVIWEDFIDALSPTRLQDEYNQAIRTCDIFVMLVATRVGKFSAEEFEVAHNQFQATHKPLIYTYFKDVDIKISQVNEKDLKSLKLFQKKLKRLGHFQTTYKRSECLCQHFADQLEKLANDGVIPTGRAEKPTGPIPKHLTRPPFIPEVFLGREADLAAVHNSLFAENHLLLLVNGEGGIGKTTLAAQYFCTYDSEYRHLAWVFAEASLLNAMLSLALPLGLDFPETLPGPDRPDRLLARMAELPGPGLLVIDNANSLADLQQHYQALRVWIDYDEARASFKISPVVQEITPGKNRERLRPDCQQLINNLIEKLAYQQGTGHLLNSSYTEAVLWTNFGVSVVQQMSVPDHGLALLCERLGNYHRTTGNLEPALACFQQYHYIIKELCEESPENTTTKNSLAISYKKLGDTHISLGQLEHSLRYFEQGFQLIKELYSAFPDKVEFKKNLAISYEKLGDTRTRLGQLEHALRYFEDEIQLFEELFKSYPKQVEFQNGLAISYSKLGSAHTSLGHLDQALDYFEQYNQLEQ